MDNSKKISELKKQLSAEIQKENSDNSVVLALSNEIVKLDNKLVRFSVDAGIINRLGKELVGRHETAVSELVKNAYDADATEVDLIFENAWENGGSLIIQDNGCGMDREELINGFMRLSSSEKIHNPKSPKYTRTRAGRKGIGRFATQRLGEKLTIITQKANSDIALKVTIDWNRFETDRDLSSISNSIEVIPKIKPEGTDLIIENLRENWSDATIKRVYRYTADLLQPFPLSKERTEQEENRTDPGFHSSYYRKDDIGLTKIIDEEEAFLKHALAEIEGYVLDDGQGCWSLESSKLDFPQETFLIGKDKDLPESKFHFIRRVHFKCYYFIYESSLLPSQSLGFIRDVANERGGIRLYRNGFRVLPYGEKGNDWIGLDLSVRRRVIITPHQNNSFFGFVEVDGDVSDLFDETSSREGVIENPAFEELTDFVYRVIISAVLKVADLRNRKGKAFQKDWQIKETVNPTEKVDSAIEKLKTILLPPSEPQQNSDTNSGSNSDSKSKVEDAFLEYEEARYEEKLEKQSLIDELNMLRILAGLGLVIGEFVHEIKRFLPGFNTDITFLKKAVKDYPDALDRVFRLDKNIKSFTIYTSYFDNSISRNVLRELEPIDLRNVVNEFRDVIQSDLERTGITLHKPLFEGFDLITIPMHPSEWASILFNLYTNSKKAIKRKGESGGQIFIRCGRENKNIFIEFSDTGDGIPTKDEEAIFTAFFTTSSASSLNSLDSEALTGTGLGLKIVRDIIESYEGTIFVATREKWYSTTIRVEIPEIQN